MRSFVAAFVVAAIVAGVLTPVVRRLALRYGVVSGTGGRHVHQQRIPRLGGVAIAFAVLLPIVGLFVVESAIATLFQQEVMKVIGLCAGAVLMCTLGVFDDLKGVRALHKLLAHVAIATFAYGCGFRIDAVSLPILDMPLSMGVFALPVTVAWIVGITNAINLIDGLDGLAAGVVFFAALTNFVVATISGAEFSALIMATVMGGVLGFLFYNFNPARIFMGDSGSYMLGYVIAVTSLAGAPKASTAVALLVPVVALGVPIFDTLFAIVRRFLERRPLFSPDRGHIHHRLLAAGVTHRRAVLILYGVSIVFTVSAIGIYLGRSWQIGVALLIASAGLIGLVRFVGVLSHTHLLRRQKARMRSRDTERLRGVIPSVPERFARPKTQQELFAALIDLAEEADFAAVLVRRPGQEEPIVAWNDRKSEARRVVATMVYPLGRDALARAELVVSSVNDSEDDQMSPQSEILFQVIADILSANLERVGSELAPRASVSSTEPTAAPDSARASQAAPEVAG